MIIYGSRASHQKTIQLTSEVCPHCGTQGSLILSTYARYAHIFWIPLFPIGRVSASQCQHCKHVMEQKQMPAQIRAYHERNIAETRLPLWQFAGLALFVLGVVSGIVSDARDKEQRAGFLQSPQTGDIYEYKTKKGAFTTFRIALVSNDTIAVSFNDYEVDRSTGLYKIDKEENYSKEIYTIGKAELQKMFDSGEILDINRK